MRKALALLALALVLTQCGPKKKLPAGAPQKLKTEALLDSISKAENKVVSLQFRAAARLESPSLNQSFKLEVRLIPDSLIWLDFADPILGIKVARAILYPDSVAFVNKFEHKYLTGRLTALQQQFNFDFDFFDLQAILMGNLVPQNLSNFKQYASSGLYQLANFEQDPEKQQNTPPTQERFVQLFFEPNTFKPSIQEQNEPVNGRRYSLLYADFSDILGISFPQRIKVEFASNELKVLEMEVHQLEVNPSLNFPFSIPSGYAKM